MSAAMSVLEFGQPCGAALWGRAQAEPGEGSSNAMAEEVVKPINIKACNVYCKAWSTGHRGFQQQYSAEFCADAAHGMLGVSWGSFEERCQTEPPVRHSLQCPIPMDVTGIPTASNTDTWNMQASATEKSVRRAQMCTSQCSQVPGVR